MSIPLNWLGTFEGSIQAINPPESLSDYTGSVYFDLTWVQGMLWWKKPVTKRVELFHVRYSWFWPGSDFDPVNPILESQLNRACAATIAKRKALEQAGL